jgi:hypothetical protein
MQNGVRRKQKWSEMDDRRMDETEGWNQSAVPTAIT